MSKKVPFKEALLFIVLSTILVSGTATFAFFYYLNYITHRAVDPKFTITAIAQSKKEGPYLQNGYFLELLGFAVDLPINLYALHKEQAVKRLNDSPLIKHATIKKIHPGTVFVEYISREPVAYLGEYTNTAIDSDGVCFPYQPFMEFRRLPVVYLGKNEPVPWGKPLMSKEAHLALKIIQELKDQPVKSLDVSKAYALSSGTRQIIVIFEDEAEHFLRLTTKDYLKQITQYHMLKNHISGNKVIDLRISGLAYIQ